MDLAPYPARSAGLADAAKKALVDLRWPENQSVESVTDPTTRHFLVVRLKDVPPGWSMSVLLQRLQQSFLDITKARPSKRPPVFASIHAKAVAGCDEVDVFMGCYDAFSKHRMLLEANLTVTEDDGGITFVDVEDVDAQPAADRGDNLPQQLPGSWRDFEAEELITRQQGQRDSSQPTFVIVTKPRKWTADLIRRAMMESLPLPPNSPTLYIHAPADSTVAAIGCEDPTIPERLVRQRAVYHLDSLDGAMTQPLQEVASAQQGGVSVTLLGKDSRHHVLAFSLWTAACQHVDEWQPPTLDELRKSPLGPPRTPSPTINGGTPSPPPNTDSNRGVALGLFGGLRPNKSYYPPLPPSPQSEHKTAREHHLDDYLVIEAVRKELKSALARRQEYERRTAVDVVSVWKRLSVVKREEHRLPIASVFVTRYCHDMFDGTAGRPSMPFPHPYSPISLRVSDQPPADPSLSPSSVPLKALFPHLDRVQLKELLNAKIIHVLRAWPKGDISFSTLKQLCGCSDMAPADFAARVRQLPNVVDAANAARMAGGGGVRLSTSDGDTSAYVQLCNQRRIKVVEGLCACLREGSGAVERCVLYDEQLQPVLVPCVGVEALGAGWDEGEAGSDREGGRDMLASLLHFLHLFPFVFDVLPAKALFSKKSTSTGLFVTFQRPFLSHPHHGLSPMPALVLNALLELRAQPLGRAPGLQPLTTATPARAAAAPRPTSPKAKAPLPPPKATAKPKAAPPAAAKAPARPPAAGAGAAAAAAAACGAACGGVGAAHVAALVAIKREREPHQQDADGPAAREAGADGANTGRAAKRARTDEGVVERSLNEFRAFLEERMDDCTQSSLKIVRELKQHRGLRAELERLRAKLQCSGMISTADGKVRCRNEYTVFITPCHHLFCSRCANLCISIKRCDACGGPACTFEHLPFPPPPHPPPSLASPTDPQHTATLPSPPMAAAAAAAPPPHHPPLPQMGDEAARAPQTNGMMADGARWMDG
ncbi:unnamed protein product [Vitrella brassicaformis CCMP3155]|uniref:RING-type domain-containing protein n=1 Tax=Vitrella brassicaformis (strain CCMP3155) TaxID=1169540 RepID=A0A0G4FFG6_VITBC|nr:unnamed protein product [Vitrella brassicaformis CCMP3155]|eukprot:CEM11912.1 unnamed protein product [Vitrella brassicaformis CCMP3155]